MFEMAGGEMLTLSQDRVIAYVAFFLEVQERKWTGKWKLCPV